MDIRKVIYHFQIGFIFFWFFTKEVHSENIENKIYSECPETCEQCIDSKCTSCYDGFYLHGKGTCELCPSNKLCSKCSSNESCQQCDYLYHLNSNGVCERDQCLDNPNCSNCKYDGMCLYCKPGYEMIDNFCFPLNKNETSSFISPIKHEKCFSSAAGCQKCKNENTCEECADGYYQSGSNCKKCDDKNCYLCNSVGKCEKCSLGFYLNEENKCLNCSSNCLICSDDTFCRVCKPDFNLYKGECVSPCLNKDSNCKLCNDQNVCKLCNSGFYLNKTECFKCHTPNCINCLSNGVCKQCEDGFRLVDRTSCISNLIDGDCEVFNSDMSCDKCKDGYKISSSGICRDENEENCKINEYFFLNKCLECSKNFDLCFECTQFSCRKCKNNAELKDGRHCTCIKNYFYIESKCLPLVCIWGTILCLLIVIFMFSYLARRSQINYYYSPNESIESYDGDIQHSNNVELKMLVGDGCHGSRCAFGDANEPNWKLNCGGYICNDCSLNVINKIIEKDFLKCPKCKKEIIYFNYIDRTTGNTSSNSIEISIKRLNFEPIDDTKKCQICSNLESSKVIKCGSKIPHRLCSYCMKRIFRIERDNLCPFCRNSVESEKDNPFENESLNNII